VTLCASQKFARAVNQRDQRLPCVVILQRKLAVGFALHRVPVHLHLGNLSDEGGQLRFAHGSTC